MPSVAEAEGCGQKLQPWKAVLAQTYPGTTFAATSNPIQNGNGEISLFAGMDLKI